jgi:hypothetical protein
VSYLIVAVHDFRQPPLPAYGSLPPRVRGAAIPEVLSDRLTILYGKFDRPTDRLRQSPKIVLNFKLL